MGVDESQKRKTKEILAVETSTSEMAGCYVYAHPEQGRADGAVLRILQQRRTGKTAEGRSG